jgi:hypothetical protein
MFSDWNILQLWAVRFDVTDYAAMAASSRFTLSMAAASTMAVTMIKCCERIGLIAAYLPTVGLGVISHTIASNRNS